MQRRIDIYKWTPTSHIGTLRQPRRWKESSCFGGGLFRSTTASNGEEKERRRLTQSIHYHRRSAGCILAGDTEGGGLAMVMPVAGLMIGMALRARVAAGW